MKLAAFVAVLTVVFGAAALAGAAVGPEPDDARDDAAHDGETTAADESSGDHAEESSGGHGADPVRGLAVAESGLRVEVAEPELARGQAETLRFRVVAEDGSTLRDFDVTHEKRMHLILARRDLTGFQHLHPEQLADGTWAAEVTLREAGSYRLFADFSHAGEAVTLAADLRVDGAADLRPLPAPAATATTEGYEVRLDAEGDDLRFAITKDGEPVTTEPYLGAGGHLVALREGDLAFLHVHPTSDDAVRFATTFPTAGRYRLFLQFQHEGRVHTAAFTHEVG